MKEVVLLEYNEILLVPILNCHKYLGLDFICIYIALVIYVGLDIQTSKFDLGLKL